MIIGIKELNNKITFGKHKGKKWGELVKQDPSYMVWCFLHLDHIKFTSFVTLVTFWHYYRRTLKTMKYRKTGKFWSYPNEYDSIEDIF